jgi:FMN phosphatase YigB (HAD superfamily)
MQIHLHPKSKKYEWVIFDLGGVLIDWKSALTEVAKVTNTSADDLHKFIISHIQELELGLIQEARFWQLYAKHANTTFDWNTAQSKWVTSQIPVSSSLQLVKGLSQYYNLAICTNNWLGVVEEQVQKIPELNFFIEIFNSSLLGFNKPHEKMYAYITQFLQTTPEKIFFVDDSLENVSGALKYGWYAYHFKLGDDQGKYCCEELKKELL